MISADDRNRLLQAIGLKNEKFMDCIIDVIHKYERYFSDEDITSLTDKDVSHSLFKHDYPVLLKVDYSEDIKKQIYKSGNYRYYAKKTCMIKGVEYFYTSQLYGLGDAKTHGDNRTPLGKWVCEKLGVVVEPESLMPVDLWEEKVRPSEQLGKVANKIAVQGYKFDYKLIANFYLCLKSKPFVILAGTSGTGKSKLVKLFAEAIGADYSLISVRPDWSDSSDLLGHTDLQGNYIAGDLLDAIKKASHNPQIIHFVCLDEMNLARVEYYLSDFLSLIETREWKGKEIVTTPLRIDEAAGKEYLGLYIPENLYIVGTVNMDETTFPFSKKVLDRANTIEFSEVDLVPVFSEGKDSSDDEPKQISNDFLVSKYLVLEKDIIKSEEQEFATEICKELQNINKILEKANAHVGYRVRDEIVFYMLNNQEADLLKRDEAFDFEIMQKILPRIQGSTTAVKDLLIELFKEFGGDFTTGSSDLIWKQMRSYIGSDKPKKYPKSVQKICYMMRKFEEDGFTSYWI